MVKTGKGKAKSNLDQILAFLTNLNYSLNMFHR